MMVCSLDFLFFIHIIVSTLTCSSTIIVCEALHSPSRYHLASLFPDWPPSGLSFSPRVFTFFTLFCLQLWSTLVSIFPPSHFSFSFTPVESIVPVIRLSRYYNSVLTYSQLFSCCGHSYSLFSVVYLAR